MQKLKFVDLNENVHQPASKMSHGCQIQPMKTDLRKIEIPSMKYQQTGGDMIMVYKVLNICDTSLENLFAVDNNSIIRKHNFKPNNWNSLLYGVANATSINSFKN